MLIYLNGTSSSGKTSIAKELQKLIQKPVLYFSIDTLLYSLAIDDLEAIMGKQPFRTPINWESIFSGYFSCLTALINAGNCVIADCPVFNENLASLYETNLGSISRKAIVKITCSLAVLEDREKNRKNRAFGIAEKQFEKIHNYLTYNLEIDTEKLSSELSAKKYLIFLT